MNSNNKKRTWSESTRLKTENTININRRIANEKEHDKRPPHQLYTWCFGCLVWVRYWGFEWNVFVGSNQVSCLNLYITHCCWSFLVYKNQFLILSFLFRCGVMWQFVFDPKITPYSRVVRQSKKSAAEKALPDMSIAGDQIKQIKFALFWLKSRVFRSKSRENWWMFF